MTETIVATSPGAPGESHTIIDRVEGTNVVIGPYARQQINNNYGDIIVRVDSLEELPPTPGEPPYKGLTYYTEADAGIFFGREQLSDDLAARLETTPFLAVAGASGSGKSSLLRAGVIPRLRRRNWLIHILTPTADPLIQLANSLTHDDPALSAADDLRVQLAADPQTLRRAAEKRVARANAARLLLIADQFEELFTQCHDEAARRAFIDNLLAAARVGGNVTVLIGLRADFTGRLTEVEALRALVEQNFALLGPMQQADLVRVIAEPARIGGWAFVSGLVEQFLSDAGQEPGRLPLLSHALLETWTRRSSHVMTLKGYREAGGVEGAIAKTAEDTLRRLDEHDEQPIMQAIFLSLTELGEGSEDTRRIATRAEMARAGDPAAVEAVLNTLAVARLVTVDADGVQVAHEALIRRWPRLREWLADNRERLRFERQLEYDAREWERLGHDEGALYRGARLATIEEQLAVGKMQLASTSAAFVEASVARRRIATRNRRLLMTGLAALALLATAAALLAFVFAGQARTSESLAEANAATAEANAIEAERQSRLAFARQLSAQSRNEQGDMALLLALKASMIADPATNHPLVETEEALREILSRWSHWEGNLGTHEGRVVALALLAEDEQLISAGQDGRVVLWSSADGSSPTILMETNSGVTALAVDDRGPRLAIGTGAGKIHLLDIRGTPQTLAVWQAHDDSDPVLSLEFASNGDLLVSGGGDNKARIWRLDDLTQPLTYDSEGWARAVSVSSDGRWLAVGGEDNKLRVWDLSAADPDGPMLTDDGFRARVNTLDFDPAAQVLAAGSEDGTIHLISLREPSIDITALQDESIASGVLSLDFGDDPNLLLAGTTSGNLVKIDLSQNLPVWRTLISLGTAIESLVVSPVGHKVITGDRRGAIRAWYLEPENAEPSVLTGHEAQVRGLAFLSEPGQGTAGDMLVSADQDGTVILWSQDGQSRHLPEKTDGVLYAIDVSPDGQWLVTGGETVQLWALADLAAGPRRLPGHVKPVISVRFSPDGKSLASGSLDRTILIWDLVDLEAEPRRLAGHLAGMYTVAFNRDGSTLAAGDEVGTLYLWELRDLMAQPLKIGEHHGSVRAIAFSPDGQYVVSAGDDGLIKHTPIGEGLPPREKTVDDVTRARWVIFSPDGTVMATAGDDGMVKLWQNADPDRDPVRLRGHGSIVRTLAFSPDGRRLASGGDDRSIYLWAMGIHALQEMACARVARDFSQDEWDALFISEPYQPLCSQEVAE